MSKLTKKELAWVDEVQRALNSCPSKRMGFYTIGDREVIIYDNTKSNIISEIQNTPRGDYFCSAVELAGAHFGESITFPNPVEATAG